MNRTDSVIPSRQRATRGTTLLSILLSTTMLWACSSSMEEEPESGATVYGVVTDEDGTQKSAFGGQGTVAAATQVWASTVGDDGSLELVGEAELAADGSYEIVVPADSTHVVLQAVDASGEVVASAVVEATGSVDSETIATPMDTESSVETEVFLAMVAQGTSPDQANIIDLRGRIDQSTAVAVRAAQEAGEAEDEIAALALAIATAQAAEIEAYAEAGVTTTQKELFELELQASQALSAALHSGENLETAYTAFFDGLAQAAESVGAGAREQSSAEASASMSFRLTLEAKVDAAAESQEVLQSAQLMAATLEAWTSARATTAVLAAGDAAAELQDAALAAADQLVADVAAATTIEQAAQAYAAFSATLIGDGSVEGSILGDYLTVDATTKASVEAAIDAASTAAGNFDTNVQAAVDAALEAGSAVDPAAVAQAVVNAWSELRAALQAAISSNQDAFDPGAETSMYLMLQAVGGFRASS